MRKVAAVEEAKSLMQESQDWGVMRWLVEKWRVRQAADQANDSLSGVEKKVKSGWTEEMKLAYKLAEAQAAANGNARSRQRLEKALAEAAAVAGEIKDVVQRVWEADDEAERIRLDAEAIFADADKRMSTSLAKKGAERAIEAWDLREKAIRRAEAAIKTVKPAQV